jgi:hypothetical protein
VIALLDMGVPQGRGLLRFRSHWQQNQEKPIPDKNCARTKTVKKRRKRMAKKKHRKLLRKTRVQRRNKK